MLSPVPSWHCPHSLGMSPHSSFCLISAPSLPIPGISPGFLSLPMVTAEVWPRHLVLCPVPCPQAGLHLHPQVKALLPASLALVLFLPLKLLQITFFPTAEKEIFLLHICSEIWAGWTRAVAPSLGSCADPLPAAGGTFPAALWPCRISSEAPPNSCLSTQTLNQSTAVSCSARGLFWAPLLGKLL